MKIRHWLPIPCFCSTLCMYVLLLVSEYSTDTGFLPVVPAVDMLLAHRREVRQELVGNLQTSRCVGSSRRSNRGRFSCYPTGEFHMIGSTQINLMMTDLLLPGIDFATLNWLTPGN